MLKRLSIFVLFLFYHLSLFAAIDTVGNEQVVNDYTAGWQGPAKSGIGPSGDYVVGWLDQNFASGNQSPLFIKFYNAAGQALSGTLYVDYGTEFDLVRLGNGETLIVMANENGGNSDIYFYLYSSTGSMIRGPELVNSTTLGNQFYPSVAANANGQFAVLWRGEENLFYRRYDYSGNRISPEIQANLSAGRLYGDIALFDDGRIVIAYSFLNSGSLIVTRLFQANDQGGSEYRMDSGNYSSAAIPAIAAHQASGNYSVVWQAVSNNTLSTLSATRSQSNTLVHTQTVISGNNSEETVPAIAATGNGFIITWNQSDGNRTGIFTKELDSSGGPGTAAVQLNQYITGVQTRSALSVNSASMGVVTWQSYGQDGDSYAIIARRVSVNPASIVEQEPNGSIASSNYITNGMKVIGTISTLSDYDYFRANVPPNTNAMVKLKVPGNANYDVYVYERVRDLFYGGYYYRRIGTGFNSTGVDESVYVRTSGNSVAFYVIIVPNQVISTEQYELNVTW